MDAIFRERRAGQGLRASAAARRGFALTGVVLSNTLDNRRRAIVICPDHLPGSRFAAGATCCAIAHRNAAISRAIAAMTNGRFLPAAVRPTVTGAQANLRLPGDCANRFGQPLEPRLQGLADAGRIPVAPGTLDQYPPGTFVAGQCETGTPNPLASRPLRWHQAEKGHQLARIVEPPQITRFPRQTSRPLQRRRRASLDRLRPPAPSTSSARFPPLVGRADVNG